MMYSRNLFAGATLAFSLLLAAGTAADAQQVLGVSPALPTSADQLRISVARPVDSCTYGIAIQGGKIILDLKKSDPGCKAPPPPDPFLAEEIFVPPLPAGSYILDVMTEGNLTDSRPIFVQAPSTKLSLMQGRFTVSVDWMTPSSGSTAANAVQLSDGSGYFWFFGAEDVDLTIKMIDAVALSSHYWFFASSGTSLAFTITVTDTWLDLTHTYQSPAGVNQNILDFTSLSYLP